MDEEDGKEVVAKVAQEKKGKEKAGISRPHSVPSVTSACVAIVTRRP